MSPLSALWAALRVYAAGVAVVVAQLLRRCRGGFVEPVFSPQPDRVAIVTGGTDGIGFATAKRLARLGMTVILAGNNEPKAEEAVARIKEETLNDRVDFLYCDLASLRSVRCFVDAFKRKNLPLHVLVNNAGVMMVPQRRTVDGFEEHFGVNYLGHFLLTRLLLDTLVRSGRAGRSARVVTVSSATHYVGTLDLDDLQSSARYSPHGAYAQSKLALVLFTYHLQALLAAQRQPVTANVVDPGVVNTELYRHVFWGPCLRAKMPMTWCFFKSPDEGAWTSVYAAVAPELEGVGGRYLYNEREARSLAATYDPELQRRLWARSCLMAGLPDAAADARGAQREDAGLGPAPAAP
ncbi:dehydrogenase/reductase SDR family member on chromosome X [Rousettus aegyptiacus]|uniref:Polyprenol dehydrogenase n=1 Tax=Rousettus aegyptiacus TaxID=9407 RepID=A0A7J8B874_ROUAE|nr:dehydrogenase/reductase SDR family member on chromosome X [Rousettus aegyptiacus]KAF6394669.1 dehydrogenase/reductase X-linked [Rousettus aegyptiacus]